MWCACSSKGKTASGYRRQKDSDLWVCGKCSQPTRLVFDWITSMRAPKDATALLSVHGTQYGIYHNTFATTTGERKTVLAFAPYPKRPEMEKTNPGALLERTWELLDSKVDIILGSVEGTDDEVRQAKQQARYEARGIAEVLAVLMDPFFTNADEVVREAKRRFEARQASNEYETPGLASEIWEPKPMTKSKASNSEKPTTATVKNTKPLPPEAVAGAKKALESGKFTAAQIAKMYGVSEESVKAAVGS